MNRSYTQRRTMTILLVGIALALSLGLWGCSGDSNNAVGTDATTLTQDQSLLMGKANPRVADVMAAIDKHSHRLLENPDIIGTAVTHEADGTPVMMIMFTSESARNMVPGQIDGVRVKPVLTDRFVAMKGKPPTDPGGEDESDHTGIQTAPIKMGTSGGWKYDLANGYCCVGTLGSLIQVGNSKRILSNYHVFEADIVNGGNGRKASNGDPIIQPGLADVGCNVANTQDVATLVVTSSIPGSNVDCSSANIIPGMVDESGYILEVGTISSQTTGSFVGQDVKKSGRTSGLTRGTVAGYYATVSITYENECAGGTAFTKVFTNQIAISRGSKFLKGGDSGSLMVEDVTTNPRAVGLLYAGGRTYAIANPIDEVLDFFNATMVGN